MTSTIERAQSLKTRALEIYTEARAKTDEWEGKSMPADAFNTVEKLYEEGNRYSRLAEQEQAAHEADQKSQEVLETKRMLTSTATATKGGQQDNTDWDAVMRTYGLKRWQVNDVKQSIGNITTAFEHSRRKVLADKGIEYKALSESAATSGATITPDIFVPQFVNKLYLNSHLRQAGARVVPLRSDITRYPKMTTASAKADLIAELAAATAVNATLGEQAFTAYMFRALQQASIELVADAEFDVLSEIILPDMAQQFAAAENSFFTLGTGSSQPEGLTIGIIAGSTNTIPTTVSWATSATINFDDIINLMHQPPPQYRQGNTAFMCNDTVIKTLRKVKATSAGTYIWEPSQQVGQPDTIYGKPVYYNQSMTTAVTAGVYPMLYGNMDYFWIGDRAGLEVKTANELYLGNAEIGYFAFKRVDSHVMQNEAFAILKGT
jgi:HK97 family phage major capsid protein